MVDPPECPDMNPIENLWHEMKEYLCRDVKPRNKNQFIEGTEEFWKTVTVDKCTSEI